MSISQSQVLTDLERELEASGLKPGTPTYDKEYRFRKVLLCKEAKSVSSCWECNYFDHCELIKGHLKDMYKVDEVSK